MSSLKIFGLAMILFFSGSCSQDLLITASEGIGETFECLPKLINLFIGVQSTESYQSRASTPAIREICPHLEQTCCDEEILTKLKNQFLKGKGRLWDLHILLKSTITVFRNKMTIINTLTSNKNMELIQDCMDGDNTYSLSHYINDANKNVDMHYTSLNSILNYLSEFYSGFACEICNGKFPSAFIADEIDMKMKYSVDNVHTMYEMYLKIFVFDKFVLDFSRIGKAAYCLKNESAKDFGNNITDEQMTHYVELMTSCIDLDRAQIPTNTNCLGLVKKFGYTSELRILSSIEDMLTRTKEAFSHLEEAGNQTQTEVTGSESVIFYPLNEKSEKSFLTVKYIFGTVDGVRMVANPMNEKIWKSSKIIETFTIALFAWYFIMNKW